MIKIVRNHKVTKSQAISKIDIFLNQLMSQTFPNEIKIIEPKKQWNNDIMNFSFKAKKGFFSTTIEGKISVDDTNIILTTELPGIVKTFVPEEKIIEVINSQLEYLF